MSKLHLPYDSDVVESKKFRNIEDDTACNTTAATIKASNKKMDFSPEEDPIVLATSIMRGLAVPNADASYRNGSDTGTATYRNGADGDKLSIMSKAYHKFIVLLEYVPVNGGIATGVKELLDICKHDPKLSEGERQNKIAKLFKDVDPQPELKLKEFPETFGRLRWLPWPRNTKKRIRLMVWDLRENIFKATKAHLDFPDVLVAHLVVESWKKGGSWAGGPINLSDASSRGASAEDLMAAKQYFYDKVSNLGLPEESVNPLIEKYILGRFSAAALPPATTIPVRPLASDYINTNRPTGDSSLTTSLKS